MNMGNAVFLHFLRRVFDIATRASAAGCESRYFGILIFVCRKGSFAAGKRTKAFATGAGVVAVADNYSDFNLFHCVWDLRFEYVGFGKCDVGCGKFEDSKQD